MAPTRSAEKRAREEAEAAEAPAPETRRAKRRRWDDGDAPAAPPAAPPAVPPPPPPGASAAAPAKPALPNMDALAKAKAVLQKQKELAAKLASVPKLATPAAAPSAADAARQTALARALEVAAAAKSKSAKPAPAAASAAPRALRLNAAGEEIDEDGNVIVAKVREVSTFKVNEKTNKLEEFAALERATEAEAAAEADDLAWMDPRMGAAGRRRERKGGFQFVVEGKFQKQADMARLQAKFGETEARKIAAREARERRNAEQMEKLEADADPNLIPLGARLGVKGDAAATAAARAAATARLPPVPDVEWWDAPLLANGTYDDVRNGAWNVAEDKMTLYVEHPVPMEPPVEGEAPPPQPLMLTKKEQKKLRTQRRRAREEEKQEMIRQGLMEAPKPKVKISNLMRVLTDEATADPTAVEREVREQMKERADAHEDRNLARMLTPAERKEKKMRKLFDDPNAGGETQVHVYRVESMSNPRNKFKVDINAQENHLTGVCLVSDSFCVIIVEGGVKAVRRYEKLMMRRIDWSAPLDDAAEEEEDPASASNKCTCVWKGTTTTPTFRGKFRFETVRSEAAARKYLADMNLAHFYDAAAAAVAVDGPIED